MEPGEGRQPLPLGEALGALLLEAMRYAMDVRVQSKDDLMPGMMIELEDGLKTIVMFPEANVERGRAELRNGTSEGRKIVRAVLFWEAWVTLEAERQEAVMFDTPADGVEVVPKHGLASAPRSSYLHPGMKTLQIEETKRHDGLPGKALVSVQPSQKYAHAVLFDVNNEVINAASAPGTNHWARLQVEARSMAEQVLEGALR